MELRQYLFGQHKSALYPLENRVILACHYARYRGGVRPLANGYFGVYGSGLPRDTVIENIAMALDDNLKIIKHESHVLEIEGLK